MQWLNSLLAILTGLALRLAIPIAITLLAIYILRQVDIRWQKEATSAPQPVIEKPHCWEIKKCPLELRRNCSSPASPEPCWQAHRLSNGYMREECLACQVFHQAPVPILIHL